MSENPAEIMRLTQTTFIADGLYLFVGKSEHIFCLRDSPVHQVAADTDTKLLPEHAGQIVFTDKKNALPENPGLFSPDNAHPDTALQEVHSVFFRSASLCFSPGCQDSFIRSVSR